MVKNLERKIYTNKDAVEKSVKYFKRDEMAARNWVNKYALKDSHGNIYESNPNQMHERLANEIARVENQYKNPLSKDKIYSLIKDFKYIVPQGGPMTGIGNPYQVASLSNCFVIGGEGDSYGAIMQVDQEQVQLMKRRGGVGHDLSQIRPNKSPVNNSALTSTGVVPFAERYSNSTREVAQDGRRGALMLSLSIEHPDSAKFIDAKMVDGKITGANMSLRINDEFMKAVKENKNYTQKFPVESANPLVTKEVNAKEIWDKIIHNAWKKAEPGVLFWDTIIRESVPDCYSDLGYKTVSTNPCGEIPLCPYDSCRLLAVNLYSYVEKPFTPEAKFNFDLFKGHLNYAHRISDDIIDLEIEKIDTILAKVKSDPEKPKVKRTEIELWENIRHKAEEGRRMGLGITAEGDMLAALGLTYGTEEATNFSEEVHKTIALETYRASVDLAKERGAFKIYDAEREKNNPFINRLKDADPVLYNDMTKHGRRNIALLTIAPTGTTSMMTQTTSGIEPLFSPSYQRRRKVNPNDKDVKIDLVDEVGDSWEKYNVFHNQFETWLQVNNYDIEKVKKLQDKDLEEIIKKSPYYKATANDVDWKEKIRMQGKIQKWIDHSISTTTNLPSDVKEELVSELYMKAWEEGCKGVTIYRDGSRTGVLLTGKEKSSEKTFPAKRPKSLEADVMTFNNTFEDKDGNQQTEKWIAFIGKINNKPYEIFTGKMDEDVLAVPKSIKKGEIVKETNGKSHYDFHFKTKRDYTAVVPGISDQFNREYWNYARLLSALLQQETPIEDVVHTVDKLEDTEGINSWKAGVKRTLKQYIVDGTQSKESCPTCEQHFIFQGGCKTCACGDKCE